MVSATLLSFPRVVLEPRLSQTRLAEPYGGARCARSHAELTAARSSTTRKNVAVGMPPKPPAASSGAQLLGIFRSVPEPELTTLRQHGEHAGRVWWPRQEVQNKWSQTSAFCTFGVAYGQVEYVMHVVKVVANPLVIP